MLIGALHMLAILIGMTNSLLQGFYHTAMRYKTLDPLKINGIQHDSLRERVLAYLDLTIKPTNAAGKPGRLFVEHQTSSKDILASEDRSGWEHRFVGLHRKDTMMHLQVLGVLEALDAGFDGHLILVWLPPTDDCPAGHVGPLYETQEAFAADIGNGSQNYTDIQKLWKAVAFGGNGTRCCITCHCSVLWGGQPQAVGFSKCEDTCRGVGGSCENGCSVTDSDGKGDDNLESSAKAFTVLMKARNWTMLMTMTDASARTLSRRAGVNWGGVSLSDMTGLLACNSLDWSLESPAAKMATKWRSALLAAGEVGHELVLTAELKHKGPLLSDDKKFFGAGATPTLSQSSRSLLSMAISRHRGATHMTKALQDALLKTVVAVDAKSEAVQARQMPTALDYDSDDFAD